MYVPILPAKFMGVPNYLFPAKFMGVPNYLDDIPVTPRQARICGN